MCFLHCFKPSFTPKTATFSFLNLHLLVANEKNVDFCEGYPLKTLKKLDYLGGVRKFPCVTNSD